MGKLVRWRRNERVGRATSLKEKSRVGVQPHIAIVPMQGVPVHTPKLNLREIAYILHSNCSLRIERAPPPLTKEARRFDILQRYFFCNVSLNQVVNLLWLFGLGAGFMVCPPDLLSIPRQNMTKTIMTTQQNDYHNI